MAANCQQIIVRFLIFWFFTKTFEKYPKFQLDRRQLNAMVIHDC